jgi:hypothetical protein
VNKVAKKDENTAVATLDINALISETSGMGTENISPDAVATPRLKVAQSADTRLKELTRADGSKAHMGDIYDTVNLIAYDGEKGIKIVPCYFKQVWTHWGERGTGTGAPLAIYQVGDKRPPVKRASDNKEYVIDNNNNMTSEYIELNMEFYCLVIDDNNKVYPVVLSLKSTGLKVGRVWNSIIHQQGFVDGNGEKKTYASFACIYHARIKEETKDKYSWYNWEITLDEQYVKKLQDKEGTPEQQKFWMQLFMEAKSFHEGAKSNSINVSQEEHPDAPSEVIADTSTSDNIPF